MKLDNKLISDFVKAMDDSVPEKKQTILYGTTYVDPETEELSVKIDGSMEYTPCESVVNVGSEQRVTVTIENHQAIITGCISDKAATESDIEEIEEELEELEEKVDEEVKKTIEELAEEVAARADEDKAYFEEQDAVLESLIASAQATANGAASTAGAAYAPISQGIFYSQNGQLYINAEYVKATGLSASKIRSDSLLSSNWEPPGSGETFSKNGTAFYLDTGELISKYFTILQNNALFRGDLTSTDGTCRVEISPETNGGGIKIWRKNPNNVYYDDLLFDIYTNGDTTYISGGKNIYLLTEEGSNILIQPNGIYHGGWKILTELDILTVGQIPDLPASIITSGTFAAARIPNLSASKITSGTFDGNRVNSVYTRGSTTRPPIGTTTGSGGVDYISTQDGYGVRVWGYYGGTSIVSGNLTGTSSDIRLKENIEDSTVNALEYLNKIKCRQFDWKNREEHWACGMVADEIEELDPQLTIGGGYDEDGCMNIKSVNDFYLQGYMLKAIQELSQQVNDLKAEIKELKGGN